MFPYTRHDLACFWVWAEMVPSVSLGWEKWLCSSSGACALPGGAGVLCEEGPGVHEGKPHLSPLESRQQKVRAHFSKPCWCSSLRQRSEESHWGPHWRYRDAWWQSLQPFGRVGNGFWVMELGRGMGLKSVLELGHLLCMCPSVAGCFPCAEQASAFKNWVFSSIKARRDFSPSMFQSYLAWSVQTSPL